MLLSIFLRGIYIPSILDFLVILFIFFGIFRGYTQGVIVQTIALFALLAGIYISAIASMAFYDTIVDKSNVPLKHLPVIIFSMMFAVVVFGSNWIAIYIKKMVVSVKVTIFSRVWGAFFGAIKYLFIASILFLFIQRLDESFKLFDEESETRLFYPVSKFAPTVIPKLRFEIKQPTPMELDDITNEPGYIEELDELDE